MTIAETIPADPVAPPSSASPPAEIAKPLTWPDWHSVVDVGSAAMVIIAAFLVASFTATNSDVWPHLAYGRLFKEGKASFGVDPFSYATEGRYWTNHAWLPDYAAYLLYLKDNSGAWLVGVKAVIFAAAALVMLFIRRRGESLWPWAIGAGLAMLASVPFTQLRPMILNPLMLMLTLFIVFRLNWKAGSFRNPLLLAGLFALWGNLDNGFVFGPIVMVTLVIGELIQRTLLKGRNQHDGAFGPAPPFKELIIALVLSSVACMANPHHVHVWQWPAEFGFGLPADDMAEDGETLNVVLSPLNEKFWGSPRSGQHIGGLAALLVYLGTTVALLMNVTRLRASHLLLAVVFGTIGLRQIQMLMPASFVLAVIMAGYFNLFANRIVLKSWGHPLSRVIFLGSGIGRLVTVLLALVMIPAAWPGWLHPPGSGRRASWEVDPDEGLVAIAKTVEGWRTSGQLPPEARIAQSSTEFANYLAFFAPSEKVWMNSRWAFHASEILPFLELRKSLQKFDVFVTYDVEKTNRLVKSMNAEAVAYVDRVTKETDRGKPFRVSLLGNVRPWTMWLYAGRGMIFGVTNRSGMEYNPRRELFGPQAEPLPTITTTLPVPPRESWADDFYFLPKTTSTHVYEAEARLEYIPIAMPRYNEALVALLSGLPLTQSRPSSDDELSLPILAVREGRRAVAENQDDFMSFYALIQPYSNRQLPELYADEAALGTFGERVQQVMTIGRRALDRMPPPNRCTIDQATKAATIAEQVAKIANQSSQRDVAYEFFGKFKAYFRAGPGAFQFRNRMQDAKTDDEKKKLNDEYKKFLDQLDDQENQLEKPILDARTVVKQGNLTGLRKFAELAGRGLPLEAIAEFESAKDGERSLLVAVRSAALMLNAGMLEKAEPLVKEIRKVIDDVETSSKVNPEELKQVRGILPMLEYRVRVLEGNYRQAADQLERIYANAFPPVPEEMKRFTNDSTIIAASALGGFPKVVQESFVLNGIVPQYQQVLAAQSHFAYQAGLLAIYDGRPQEAVARLKQSLSPQGETRFAFPWTTFAKRYLAMIEQQGK